MDPLARLIGSAARLKLLRLFLFNDDLSFSLSDVAFRARVPKDTARKELNVLIAADVVKKRTGKQGTGYVANKRFEHYLPLQAFLRDTTSVSDASIMASFKKAGTLRLVVLSGLFTGAIESKVDIIVVGDRLEDRPLSAAVHSLEAELGRELRYASFSSEQFRYRLGVYDRLLRDVFDYPHRTVLDRLGLVKK